MLDAAVATVIERGYGGATSRAIAARGRFNQALVYYHFGGVDELLLAALDDLGTRRLARFQKLVDEASTLPELVDAAAAMYRADRRSGHVAFVSQLVAGSLDKPELAREVLQRMEPWIGLTREALRKAVARTPLLDVPIDELAYAVVTYYLGLNLLTQLDPRRARADALFTALHELAQLFEVPGTTAPGTSAAR